MKTYYRRALACWFLAAAIAQQGLRPTPEMYRALDHISADSLRGNLSFLASGALEGRETPSRGLDTAAEFIASRFRAAGLEPGGDDGYFQTALVLVTRKAGADFKISIDPPRELPQEAVSLLSARPLAITNAPVVQVSDVADLKTAESLKGKVVAVAASHRNIRKLAKAVAALEPALLIESEESDIAPRVADADEQKDFYGGIPRLLMRDGDLVKGLRGARISLELAQPTLAAVKARNVIGFLRGSDRALQNQYILITAHYDHLGVAPEGGIYYGANDDGSGTVSVIEIAKAIAELNPRPKRTIVFMTFFGEEEGLLGSSYYVRHPVFPLQRTVADLNLEQVGRTDASEGPEVSKASLTGFDYTNITATLREAGQFTGIKLFKAAGDEGYFDRSDNIMFARHGIPDHTIVVAYEYTDYHALGDVWQKIDYRNMAKVDRMIALGAIMLADNPAEPAWNRANPKTAPYVKAR